MKRYIPFLLLSLILSFAGYTGRAQSETKVISIETYGRLVEDAVQRRVLDTMVTELTQQLADMEMIQAQIEANLTRQIAILNAENQARETISDNWERSYGVVKKELGKKQNATKWLKVAVGAAFVLGIFAGK